MATNETINQLPAANTIDPVNDLLPIFQNSSTSTLSISRNTYLGLSSVPVGLTDTQTITNKTLTAPAVNNPVLGGTLTGTYIIGGTPTFPSSVVQLTSTQTLTNKTLTSPTINSPTITNATLSTDAITGYTTSNSGTIYGISVTTGTLGSAAYGAGSVGSAALATNGVGASNLATNAIFLGQTLYTGGDISISATSGAPATLTSMAVTVTIPAGGRKVKITLSGAFNGTSTQSENFAIWRGAVTSGTLVKQGYCYNAAGSADTLFSMTGTDTPSAGSVTYNVGAFVTGGTGVLKAGATEQALFLVEAI